MSSTNKSRNFRDSQNICWKKSYDRPLTHTRSSAAKRLTQKSQKQKQTSKHSNRRQNVCVFNQDAKRHVNVTSDSQSSEVVISTISVPNSLLDNDIPDVTTLVVLDVVSYIVGVAFDKMVNEIGQT